MTTNHHTGTVNRSWPEHSWAEAQVLQMQSDERAMRVERFAECDHPDGPEAQRLGDVASALRHEADALGWTLFQLIRLRNGLGESEPEIRCQVQRWIDERQPLHEALKEKHAVASVEYRNYVCGIKG